ncbi:hypothetical protein CASFOL_028943 [Castilleja foliolosa]|uniref:non-specific serine/threonine protein kinase n=1 Tax=Castilleja foliolosa TaxID=1961234 RepID=A0ABD3CFN5_9LAMI
MMLHDLFFLILQINLLFFSVESYESYCYKHNGNYTLNSTYSNNLDTVLSSIPANISFNGFYNGSAGSQNPDIAYAIAHCRGDVLPHICRGCIQDLITNLRAACPHQRQAVEWADDCMLKYSNQTILGNMETLPAFYLCNTENATNPNEFLTNLRGHLDNLREKAADGGGPLMKVAAGNITMNDFQNIFALVQCTPDFSPDDCRNCLISAAAWIPTTCNRRRGGRILLPSCNLRYEMYLFFNETRLQELVESPAPQPPLTPITRLPPPSSGLQLTNNFNPPGPNSGNNTTRTIIIVVVSIAGCLILADFVCIFLKKRIKRRLEKSHENVDEISTVESLKYTLSTIKAVTNDFSDYNKLGQGGFGAVYKGKLSNDREIAVKRLSKISGQGDQEFKNEVLLLAKLQHRNLVRLLGFCLEGIEKLLIYEFVQNASLDKFIFDPVKRSVLDWEKRHKIIRGIARGILYFHEDSQVRIIHRDLKPSNVLLNGAMDPKIADFGMAGLFGQDDTQ